MAQRYNELFSYEPKDDIDGDKKAIQLFTLDLDGSLAEISTGIIDAEYMESRYKKFLKELNNGNPKEIEKARNELHKSFASLSQEQQHYANMFLHDIERGEVNIDLKNMSFHDYINSYQSNAENARIQDLAIVLGVDTKLLKDILKDKVTEDNINKYGRFDELRETVDKEKAKKYFEKLEGKELKPFEVNIKVHSFLKKFLLLGGFDIELFGEQS